MLRAPLVLLRNLFMLLVYVWSSFWFRLGYLFRRKKKLYIRLELESHYPFGPAEGIARFFQNTTSFIELRQSLRRLLADKDIHGVVLIPKASAMGHGQKTELYRLLDGFSARGKDVIAHTQMPMTADYMTLLSAQTVLISPAGRLYSFGPRFEQYFVHEALEKIGIVAQFVHIGEFKTASHRFLHDQMPLAQRLMMQSLYKSLKDLLLERIATRRGLERTAADRLFEQAPMDAPTARRAGFIDGALFRESLPQWLEEREQRASEARLLSANPPAHPDTLVDIDRQDVPDLKNPQTLVLPAQAYLASRPKPYRWKPLFRRPKRFAILDLSGMIVMPNMNLPGQSSVAIDPHEVIPALRRVRKDPTIAGIILHINSPGGSALASDIIWHAIEELRRSKPVIAYCTDVVGSGGYYLAVATDEIICERTTLCGSIGVITGKMSAPGVPAKLGMNFEAIYEHDADRFASLTDPLSPQMMQRMDADARSFYRRFLQRVGQSRQITRRRLHRYARGRVYLGQAAHKRGLVDHIGGLDLAVERLAKLCMRDAKKTELAFISHRRQSLKSALRGSILRSPSLQETPLRELGNALVPHAGDWVAALGEPAMLAGLLKEDPILALMPWRSV